MKEKYGKKYSKKLLEIKSAFYLDNDRLVQEAEKINTIYNEQPLRKACKMCGHTLHGAKAFCSHGVIYYYCEKCHHLSGGHEETADFCKRIYVEEDYGKNYHENDRTAFAERTETIYLPKMDFLLENLSQDGMKKEEIHILDVGAGSGYFVQAGLNRQIDIRGIEVSDKQVAFGNAMIGEERLTTVSVMKTRDAILHSKCSVISMIGVLEHLVDFKEVLAAIKENPNIQYLFFSVPLFSYTSIFETVFQKGYNRHMGAEHTHLFTLDSIHYMNQSYGFLEVAKWQFGTDAMDLYRLMSIYLEKDNKDLKEIWDEYFLPCVNELQLVLDKNNFCSEVHMLVKK